ncbi:Peptidyl-dipeptidase A [Candidatus Sulfotelmatobacter kueseliae]|uniref:Peptidyl-dipeptidase A n=1 Tax=Candidatus Sulfotelmatobacter kueseliae TaxID=2042962 RepID=A0A2U3KCL8_9BACT|nr:Peptidyl-dipeptidase A [Candidatus Sulfotelmatobacter kueseliae]
MKLRLLVAALLFPLFIQAQTSSKPTVAEAQAFMNQAEAQLKDMSVKANRAQWVQENFITDDTQALSADANDQITALTEDLVEQAKRFDGLAMPADLQRKFLLLKLSLTAPAPHDAALRKEMTQIASSLDADYGKGKYCRKPDDCLDITAIEKVMTDSHDPNQLKEMWVGWHKVGAPMRPRYARFVELSNQGAREMGFKDVGAMWRAGYDMTPEQFNAELERLWQQVRPLYVSLHTFVRARLSRYYGPNVVPPDGPIPADLLGNPWAQEWDGIFPLLGLPENSRGYDLTQLLQARNLDAKGMVRYGEAFYKSLGLAPLPDTFWERSLFTKPRDRDVVCHASAWDVDTADDLRVKMCIQIRDVDFVTIHHELGHNFYQRAYKNQPFMFQGGANDGFHEAIGDTIALSVTPEYLQKIGLLDKVPPADADIPLLLRKALEKVAFLPFGLLIDEWRWRVFSGEIRPADYNKAWWEMRLKYQGVAPPVERSEADFDPGAKYHVAGNVPYMRYFLADILQFQFYRALCKEAGYTGPLNRCTFYQSKEAGAKLDKMLEMGQSKPWPDALEALTGQRQMDASAILDYFAPLQKWLDEQNTGVKAGW